MIFITKGTEKVCLIDKESANCIIYALNDHDCNEPIAVQRIIGSKPDDDIYYVMVGEDAAGVIGLNDAERVADWLLTVGCNEVTIRKQEDIKSAKD